MAGLIYTISDWYLPANGAGKTPEALAGDPLFYGNLRRHLMIPVFVKVSPGSGARGHPVTASARDFVY